MCCCKFWLQKMLLLNMPGLLLRLFFNSGRGINMLDLLKSLASLCLTVLSVVVFVKGIEHSIILGFVMAFLCLVASFLILQSVSSETWAEVKRQQDQKKEQQLHRSYEGNRYGYICPCCGYPAGERVDNIEEGYTYRCRNCCYIW